MIKTLKISGVTKADLTTSNNRERYAWIKNNTGGNVYASALDSTCTAGNDNVAEIAAGDVRMVDTLSLGYLWLSGNGSVEVQLSDSMNCPFKISQKGGDISASGSMVQLGGLQGGVPFSEVTVRGTGKNLYWGTLTVGMLKTENGVLQLGTNNYLSVDNFISVDSNTQYVLSNAESINVDTIFYYDKDRNYISYDFLPQEINRITTPLNCRYIKWRYRVTAPATVDMITNIQLELGDTATEYAPPITGQELTVTACGKNLVKYPYYETTKTENGITFTDNGDGTITVNGTATSHATFYLDTTITLLAGVHYVLSGAPTSTITSYRIQFAGATWEPIFACYGEPVDIVVEQDTRFRQFRIVVPSGSTCENVVFKPMIEIGSTATPYEPYSGADYTITPDSNPYTVPTEIYQQNGINTIYVTGEGEPTLSVKGVKTNAAVKRIWDKLNELTTAVIVSNTGFNI